MQVGVPEPAWDLPGFGQQRAQGGFTAQDVLLVSLQRHRMQVDMPEGVVAQLEPGITPVAQHLHARGLHLAADLKLGFVDEAHHRDAGLLQRGKQSGVLCGEIRLGTFIQPLPRKIVDGQRDASIRLSRMGDTRNARERQNDTSNPSTSHPQLPS